ncbi:MAG: DNA mismatch repair endonuclease MutL [Chitinophagales bacterium]|nr:DNA mismatch repair endonuclease MutL [Chitinophagales bacterium]
MTDVIQLLPDHISNQIAAGEVIQRPASAVKELLENAIDAGAKEIKLIVKNSGKSLIQVVDNGSGMSENDAQMCFAKHATSKIRAIEDLFAIRTKGFRGEALASIAAIAEVELKTKLKDDDTGIRVVIEGSEVISSQACAFANGTSISVRNLFYNVPARRKFLKSNTAENKHIIDEFQRICLAHPAITFSFYNDDKLVYDVKPANLRKRIVALLGDNYNERLVPVEEHTDYVSVKGFIGKPAFARKTRGEQFLFVNNRFIKSKYLNHAVYSAYEEMIQQNSYPMFILFLEVDPSRIDVNVHPSKNEVKFDDDRLVYTITNAGIKHALAQHSIIPSLDFDVEQGFGSLPGFQNHGSPVYEAPQTSNWQMLYPEPESVMTIESDTESQDNLESTFKPVQLHSKYILTQIKSGFILIDQQSAHERVLFEEFIRKLNSKKISKQQMLFPKKLEFPTHESEIIEKHKNELNELGIEVEKFGSNTFIIQALPPELKPNQVEDLFETILHYFNTHETLEELAIYTRIAQSLAISACIKRGETMSVPEMQNLTDRLFACENPMTSPSKNHCFIQFDLSEIDNKFLNDL